MVKTKKPRKPIAIHGFVLVDKVLKKPVVVNNSFERVWSDAKDIRAIGQWFLKAADWIEAQENKDD